MLSRNRNNETRVETTRCAGTPGSRAGIRVQGSGFRINRKHDGLAPRSLLHAPRSSSRRGVLLLVVLSLLVLFMMIGTAFLLSSNQYNRASKASAKLNRVGNYPTKLLDRAVMQIIRDTENPHSVIRTHSLLGDLYGTDGFEAKVAVATYARQIDAAPIDSSDLGVTQGQLIDIFVVPEAYDPTATPPLGPEHVVKLDRGVNGVTQLLNQPPLPRLSITRGYYNGSLMTVTSGLASGQTTRIVDYEFVGNQTPITDLIPGTLDTNNNTWRFRVMAFPRSDGLPLVVDTGTAPFPPGLRDLDGATILVNGRPLNGTGVGYNTYATAGSPRLTAVEAIKLGTVTDSVMSPVLYPEIALTPNSAFFFPFDQTSGADFYGARYLDDSVTPPQYRPLNPKNIPAANRVTEWRYQSFVGPGGADESYDTPDFQNVFLALQTVTPRARGRVVQGDSTNPFTLDVDDPAVDPGVFLRLDLEDLPLPSFHRPGLINFWYHRLINYAANPTGGFSTPTDDDVRAVLQPYGQDGIREGSPGDTLDDPTGVAIEIRDQIVALKRKISLRPIREDHPNFDGGNPLSRPADLSGVGPLVVGRNIAIPYWEVVGPWDVDNDNDGVPDSIWVDLGEPVAQAENGTLYKPMFAFLVVDLDSRLSVNAHGLVDHIIRDTMNPAFPPNLDATTLSSADGNLANDINVPNLPLSPELGSSNSLPQGIGYGPAEISLRPVLSPMLPSMFPANVGDPGVGGLEFNADDYARLLVGRPGSPTSSPVWGRHGLDLMPDLTAPFPYEAMPGITSLSWAIRSFGPPGVLAQFKFFDYPQRVYNYDRTSPWFMPSAFSTAPDMMGRYALGLDYAGQPVYEYTAESVDRPLVADSPYELDLSSDRRRDIRADRLMLRLNAMDGTTEYVEPTGAVLSATTGIAVDTDDAPFATADLERILRAHDADAGILPDRLWNVVDAFDPVKLMQNQPDAVLAFAQQMFNDSSITTADAPQMLAAAQAMAGINRRLTTTDSYDLPVPGGSFLGRLIYGADGQPGVAGEDDDGENGVDDPGELGWQDSDDYEPVMEGLPPDDAAPVAPRLAPDHPTIVDLLRYRVQFERRKRGLANYTEIELSAIVQQLLAPEVVAGGRLDLNRPFGDGRDNNGNGIVDDPLEAGEPFVDVNGNGRFDAGEPWIDIDRNGSYDVPRDQLWPALTFSGAIAEPIAFDHTNGQSVPIRPEMNAGTTIPGGVRNLNSQARQLYARHLYCLMMLLVDEDYAETPNVPSLGGNNTNLEFFVESIAQRRGNAGAPTAEDKRLAIRKLTARRIAQWAINCVDFRDADAIMTPFEFDENPWDGWGTLDRDGVLIPLDGDVATNENGSDKMIETDLPTQNMAQVIDWNQVPAGPDGSIGTADDNSRVVSTTLVTGPTTIADQTRGVVWGVERPELLITETLAFHDRRCIDDDDVSPKTTDRYTFPQGGARPREPFPDYTLDQTLKPRGSLFVELYNPLSRDAQKPAEFYGTPNGAGSAEGVMLNKLSDFAVNGKRSPVWRMAVVREPINGRLSNKVIDISNLDASDFESYLAQLLSTDPDGFGFSSDRDSERLVYFTTGSDPNRADDININGEYDFSQPLRPPVVNTQLNVRVPPLPYRIDPDTGNQAPAARRYFIARTERHDGPPYNDTDVPIAPILPGRYAVVGSAGLQLIGTGPSPASTSDGMVTERYVTPISRFGGQLSESEQLPTLDVRRRLELWPSTDPNLHQMLVADNGGAEFVRMGGNPENVHDRRLDGNPTNTPRRDMLIDPCVVIPVEDLNISEPVEGYPSSLYQYLFPSSRASREVHKANEHLNDFGNLEFINPYDHPLDLDFELVRNGTTQNYRSIHLQRLANPILPWNPPPLDESGNANPLHQPHLPVNPYLTIDSQSVDLTAYNGASEAENGLQNSNAKDDPQLGVDLPDNDATQHDFFAPLVPSELRFAPDHVLWGVIRVLVEENIRPWISVDEFRRMIENDNQEVVDNFRRLEDTRDSRQDPLNRRGWLTNRSRLDLFGREWGGQRGWSLLRRVLPDDPETDQPTGDEVFRQDLSLRSLERGAHDSLYLKYSNPNAPEGWWFDPRWEPRLLWKQEQPNIILFLKGNPGPGSRTVRVTDLQNVFSRRQMLGAFNPDEVRPPPDEMTRNSQIVNTPGFALPDLAFNYVLEQTLGFANESYAPELDRAGVPDAVAMLGPMTPKPGAPEVASDGSMAQPVYPPDVDEANASPRTPSLLVSPALSAADRTTLRNQLRVNRQRVMRSTYPWLAWNNRPFVSGNELMQVPAGTSSLMLRNYSVINQLTPNPYDGVGSGSAAARIAVQLAPFGHLLNFFATAIQPAKNEISGPVNQVTGAPHYYRILDYVEVPSRYVGTDTLFSPEIFNDVPGVVDGIGSDITSPLDPRINFQPPFNKVSRERDPGRVNLNTVVGRRVVDANGVPRIWSEVYDGIMHRYQDDNLFDLNGNLLQLSHFGPAWRDVTLSRRGYAQFDAAGGSMDNPGAVPDTQVFGLNRNFPTFFANPFRSSEAGDLVPLVQMQQYGVDATLLRVHPYLRGDDGTYGRAASPVFGDIRDAGFGDDILSYRPAPNYAIPNTDFGVGPGGPGRDMVPLFSEVRDDPAIDASRNPYMMYQPMTRLGNLVTTRSNVFAVWVTVGYFEVEPADDWTSNENNVQDRFGGDRALYDRVYPEGYALGQELGSDTGNTRRQRAFYIIDRSEPVGFKPGEDLNVERAIRVRRRIE